MNFALMVSNKVEEKLLLVSRNEDWSKDDEDREYKRSLEEVIAELEGKAWAEGNIRVGDFILISELQIVSYEYSY
jgi:hypothetical protein